MNKWKNTYNKFKTIKKGDVYYMILLYPEPHIKECIAYTGWDTIDAQYSRYNNVFLNIEEAQRTCNEIKKAFKSYHKNHGVWKPKIHSYFIVFENVVTIYPRSILFDETAEPGIAIQCGNCFNPNSDTNFMERTIVDILHNSNI